MFSRRSIVLAVACVTAGAVAGPPVIAGASNLGKEVFVTNGEEDAVPTRAVAPTTVQGAVGLTGETASAVAAALNGTPVQTRVTVSIPSGDTDHAAPLYTVPAGKVLTVGSMNATVRGDMRSVSIEMLCPGTAPLRWNGEIIGPDPHRAAQWSGAHVAGPGCELQGFVIGFDQAFAVVSMTGVLRNAPTG